MKIAVFSDVHGNITALEAVLSDIAARGVDKTVCLGDLAYKGPAPSECVTRLRSLGLPCTYGNTDEYLLDALNTDKYAGKPVLPYLLWHTDLLNREDMEYLAGLPFEYRIEAEGQSFLFVHATPQSCNRAIRQQDSAEAIQEELTGVQADWVVMGHIHTPFLFRFAQKTLVNCGAVGFSLDGEWRASYIIIDTKARSVQFLKVEYDIEQIARLAQERSFCFAPEWYEDALRKGSWELIPYEKRQAIDRFPQPISPKRNM
jgi:putative phosphoesterase